MPIITISRGTFSGGKSLAECLSGRLGYPCVSREVILDAAWEYGIEPAVLTTAMKKPPSFWQQLTGERIGYLNYIRAALCERALGGELVYHGHAGHLLLAGISHVIRVRVIADLESRIKDAMLLLRLDRKQAIDYIRKNDRERVKWTRFLYGVEWGDPSLYDVVLNLEHMGLDGACELLACMGKMEVFQPTPASRKAMADLTLASRVWAALTKDERTTTADVRVTADDGVVMIEGSTRSDEIVDTIALVAAQVEGVKAVHNLVAIGSVFVK